MNHGQSVREFESAFADRVGARYAIACANGTVTLQAALIALGVESGDRVAVPPLTMAATTIAALNVGAAPVFRDVDRTDWLMTRVDESRYIGVDLYGLNGHWRNFWPRGGVVDAAQTLRPHDHSAFTSYSFQASKILTTGEGGMLVTDDESLAEAARSYLSLGYAMRADQSRIDSAAIKASDYVRHVRSPAINGRMNDITAALGLSRLNHVDLDIEDRALCAALYAEAIAGCDWLTPQHVPTGWRHDYWCYAVACDTPARATWLQAEVVAHGGEMPYAAWRLTYQEPAFRHLNSATWFDGLIKHPAPSCPVAESLQPRILQFQTNSLISAQRNARALAAAIREAK